MQPAYTNFITQLAPNPIQYYDRTKPKPTVYIISLPYPLYACANHQTQIIRSMAVAVRLRTVRKFIREN